MLHTGFAESAVKVPHLLVSKLFLMQTQGVYASLISSHPRQQPLPRESTKKQSSTAYASATAGKTVQVRTPCQTNAKGVRLVQWKGRTKERAAWKNLDLPGEQRREERREGGEEEEEDCLSTARRGALRWAQTIFGGDRMFQLCITGRRW